jgi:hypothetical protein
MQANVQAFSIGKAFKRLVTKVNRAVGGAVDLVRKGLAALARLFKGSDNLVVGVRVKNSDPGFGGPNTFMLRAWGASRGQVVALPGVSVRVFQTITFQGAISLDEQPLGYGFRSPRILFPFQATVPFDALSTARTNADGNAVVKIVADTRVSGICTRLDNFAASVLDWVKLLKERKTGLRKKIPLC